MATVDVSSENIEETIGEGLSILYFTADWCPPCQQFRPIYSEISEDYPTVAFGKVDVDEAADLAAQYGVRSIPTLVAHRDGVPIFRRTGAPGLPQFKALVDEVVAA